MFLCFYFNLKPSLGKLKINKFQPELYYFIQYCIGIEIVKSMDVLLGCDWLRSTKLIPNSSVPNLIFFLNCPQNHFITCNCRLHDRYSTFGRDPWNFISINVCMCVWGGGGREEEERLLYEKQ